MYRRSTETILRWLRVPPEPQPPHGDPASLRVFRAGKNYLYLRLMRWGATQVVAMVGIIFWLGVFSNLGSETERIRREHSRPRPALPTAGPGVRPGQAAVPAAQATHPAEPEMAEAPPRAKREKRHWRPIEAFFAWQHGIASFLARLPPKAVTIIWFFEMAGLVLYVLQLPATLILARLEYELRWYMVTDRSLRIRHGVWQVSESTMSFANIQQVVVSQGPLQRLLGLADVKVQSAGGSGNEEPDNEKADLHLGLFHSVTNASEIRDLVLDRLRRFRETGLGDPDEKNPAAIPPPVSARAAKTDAAVFARELVAEAKALRVTVSG